MYLLFVWYIFNGISMAQVLHASTFKWRKINPSCFWQWENTYFLFPTYSHPSNPTRKQTPKL